MRVASGSERLTGGSGAAKQTPQPHRRHRCGARKSSRGGGGGAAAPTSPHSAPGAGRSSAACVHSLSTPEAAGTPGAPGAPDGEGGGPAPAPNLTSNRRLQQTQAQVDEVVDIMRVNVDKVLERDQKLSELDDRADALQAGASQFESSAAKLKNKYWWKNCKMMIIMAVVGVICVGVIFLYFFY
ncbi:vesicle-associated membrane protein 2-like [Xiphias gladius]|uniref:vesicle-associated membrane protein 2-like n=1 Tax=Xiphias gladius TaxID=8245 RepID=UPI001A994311|nr:vesicle-associated membrane protein 2-like [Xiphias gladius]